MIIPNDILNGWRLLLQSGDKTAIAEAFQKKHGYSLNTIQGWVGQVFKFGVCPDERLYQVMKKYFEEVEKKQSKPVK